MIVKNRSELGGIMKKAIGSLVVILLVIGLSSCDIKASLKQKETDELLNKAINELKNNTLNDQYFNFSMIEDGTEKNIIYDEQGFVMSQIDENKETYYKDQYLYTYDINLNTKTKITEDYKELLDLEFKENILNRIKSMLNETYISKYVGEKWLGFEADKWIRLEFDNQKLIEDNLLNEGFTAIIDLHFNNGNFYSVSLYLSEENSETNYQLYTFGKLENDTYYIYMPNDLETYEIEIEKPVTVNGDIFSIVTRCFC